MPRMLDMIRNSQVPPNLMQSAARGALSVTPAETIEILVHLALHNKMFAERARLTLAGWDEKASLAVAADPNAPAEVLEYFMSRENVRPCLLPALAENPAIKEEALDALAVHGSRSVVEALLASARMQNSPQLLQALQTNPNLRPNELEEIGKKLATETPATTEADESGIADDVVNSAVTKYLQENAAELVAEKDKPFELSEDLSQATTVGAATASSAAVVSAPVTAVAAAPAAASHGGAAAAPARARQIHVSSEDAKRDSVLQKIGKLNISGRITLAMKGNKEERAVLIRDSTKLVCLAVLDSPKISDGEVEKIALQKNVLEAVLRAIPMKRKYAKNYTIMRNLVFNPRTPLDLSLSLMKNLLVHDLKNLSGNKEVSETVRKLALRSFKQKSEKKD
jgi:hypothetical protein